MWQFNKCLHLFFQLEKHFAPSSEPKVQRIISNGHILKMYSELFFFFSSATIYWDKGAKNVSKMKQRAQLQEGTRSGIATGGKWHRTGGGGFNNHSKSNIQPLSHSEVGGLISRQPARERIKFHLALHRPLSDPSSTPRRSGWGSRTALRITRKRGKKVGNFIPRRSVYLLLLPCEYKSRYQDQWERDVKQPFAWSQSKKKSDEG